MSVLVFPFLRVEPPQANHRNCRLQARVPEEIIRVGVSGGRFSWDDLPVVTYSTSRELGFDLRSACRFPGGLLHLAPGGRLFFGPLITLKGT